MIRTLIVEDDTDYQALIESMLDFEAPATYELKYAISLEEATAVLERESVDLILLDLSLPDSSGLRTLAQVMKSGAATPIVILSGNQDEALAVKAVQEGAQDYIVKDQLRRNVLVRSMRYAVERKRAQVELSKRQSQLVNAAKLSSLGEMASGIAHEVRNPLMVIRAHVQQLRKCLGNEIMDRSKMLATADSIDDVIQRIASIIEGMLAFAREDEQAERTIEDLAVIADSTLKLCKTRLQRHDIQVTTTYPESETFISCNATQIGQIVLNLISNAYHAVETERVRRVEIEVYTDLDADDRRWAVLAIMDSGKGVSTDIRERVFQPFFTTRPVGEGTGLGLSISRGIAEAHGGTLTLDESESSSRFLLRLPLVSGPS